MTNCPDRIKFRVLLIDSSSGRILGSCRRTHDCILPLVFIPRWSRVAEQLQAGIRRQLGVTSLVLDVASGDQSIPPLVVAQTIGVPIGRSPMKFHWVHYSDLREDSFSMSERRWIERLLSSGESGRGIYSRLNWISDVFEWIRSSTPFSVSEFQEIRQLNASGHSALLCLKTDAGKRLWFKSDPREYGIARELSLRFPSYLPQCLARHDEWQAWVTEDAGRPLDSPSETRCSVIARELAKLQIDSSSQTDELLSKGLQDLRPGSLRRALPEIVEQVYLSSRSCVWRHSRQTALRSRMKRAQDAISDILDVWEDLQIPHTLCHGDLNFGNVLFDRRRCVFVDWSEAAVGIPFVNFVQMRFQLSRASKDGSQAESFSSAYLCEWSSQLTQRQLRRVIHLMPVVEAVTRLSSRHLWMSSRALSPAHVVMYSTAMLRLLEYVVSGSEIRLMKPG